MRTLILIALALFASACGTLSESALERLQARTVLTQSASWAYNFDPSVLGTGYGPSPSVPVAATNCLAWGFNGPTSAFNYFGGYIVAANGAVSGPFGKNAYTCLTQTGDYKFEIRSYDGGEVIATYTQRKQ